MAKGVSGIMKSLILRDILLLVFISWCSRLCYGLPHWARRENNFGNAGSDGAFAGSGIANTVSIANYQQYARDQQYGASSYSENSFSNFNNYNPSYNNGGGYVQLHNQPNTPSAVRPNPYNPNSSGNYNNQLKSSTEPTFGLNFQGYSAVRDSSQLPAEGQRVKKETGRSGGSGWKDDDDGPGLTDTFVNVITGKINTITTTISGVKSAIRGVKKGAAKKIARKIEGIGEFVTAITKGASTIFTAGHGIDCNKGNDKNKDKGQSPAQLGLTGQQGGWGNNAGGGSGGGFAVSGGYSGGGGSSGGYASGSFNNNGGYNSQSSWNQNNNGQFGVGANSQNPFGQNSNQYSYNNNQQNQYRTLPASAVSGSGNSGNSQGGNGGWGSQ